MVWSTAPELKLHMKSLCLISCTGPLESNEDEKCFAAVSAIIDTELLAASIHRGLCSVETEH